MTGRQRGFGDREHDRRDGGEHDRATEVVDERRHEHREREEHAAEHEDQRAVNERVGERVVLADRGREQRDLQRRHEHEREHLGDTDRRARGQPATARHRQREREQQTAARR